MAEVEVKVGDCVVVHLVKRSRAYYKEAEVVGIARGKLDNQIRLLKISYRTMWGRREEWIDEYYMKGYRQ